jgi:hypothetical protein
VVRCAPAQREITEYADDEQLTPLPLKTSRYVKVAPVGTLTVLPQLLAVRPSLRVMPYRPERIRLWKDHETGSLTRSNAGSIDHDCVRQDITAYRPDT